MGKGTYPVLADLHYKLEDSHNQDGLRRNPSSAGSSWTAMLELQNRVEIYRSELSSSEENKINVSL